MSIQTVGEILHGLSNFGRLFAYGQPIGIQQQLDGVPERIAGWYLVAERELTP